jgi:hypothetical protein
LLSNCVPVQLPLPEVLTVHVKVAEPEAPVVSVAVTVVLYVPAVLAVPLIRPVELLIDSPVGRPLAAYVSVALAESVAEIWRLTVLPVTVPWLPGLVTVTVLPVLVPDAKAVVPFGVPQPVGPS